MVTHSTISATLGAVPGSFAFGNGIRTRFGTTTVSHTVITGHDNFGLLAENTGVTNAYSNLLTRNGIAAQAGNGAADQAAATVRLSNNEIYDNRTGFGCGGGILASAGNNRKGGNTGGSVAACAPNATITQQ